VLHSSCKEDKLVQNMSSEGGRRDIIETSDPPYRYSLQCLESENQIKLIRILNKNKIRNKNSNKIK
jgi:hypothetical protein